MKGKLIKTDKGYILEGDNLPNSRRLSLKNCQAIELGYDLDELSKKETRKFIGPDVPENIMLFIAHSKMFQVGFQKALEILGDKKFSEGDVMLGWDAGVMSQAICDSNYFGLKRQEQLKEHRDSYKENLKPVSLKQTGWNVEVVYQRACCSDNFTCGDEDNCMICTQTYPKLDSDGCLILKRI